MQIFLTIGFILAFMFFANWLYNLLLDVIGYYDNHKKK